MSAEKFGLHITDAVIVGDYWKTGQIFYDGRPQGGNFIAANDCALREIAKSRKRDLCNQLGREFDRLFPDPSLWELRIWD
jgi:hypothetical protein